MIKVGLLGAGRIGQVHAANINRRGVSKLLAIADVHEPAAKALAEQYSADVASVDDIIADERIDAVLVATSTDTHSDLIEKAVDAGKAVLCEKPVDLSLERATNALAHVQKANVPVMLGFNRRFDPNFAALKSSYDAGDIGKAEMLAITSYDPAPPPLDYIKVSGGLFRDMMIHDLDIARWIMGGLPDTVSAVGSALVDPEIGRAGDVDTAAVTLTWSDGRIAVIRNSRRAVFGYDQRIELLGAEGLLQVDNVLENTVRKSSVDGTSTAKPVYFFLERYRAAYVNEWCAFVEALASESPMPVGMTEGIEALAMAEAATRSYETGERVALKDVLA